MVITAFSTISWTTGTTNANSASWQKQTKKYNSTPLGIEKILVLALVKLTKWLKTEDYQFCMSITTDVPSAVTR
jgi:hypothetical protein